MPLGYFGSPSKKHKPFATSRVSNGRHASMVKRNSLASRSSNDLLSASNISSTSCIDVGTIARPCSFPRASTAALNALKTVEIFFLGDFVFANQRPPGAEILYPANVSTFDAPCLTHIGEWEWSHTLNTPAIIWSTLSRERSHVKSNQRHETMQNSRVATNSTRGDETQRLAQVEQTLGWSKSAPPIESR